MPWYGGVIMTTDRKYGDKGMVQMGGCEGCECLLNEILAFFKTGKAPIDPEETIELFAFMEAAAQSFANGGRPGRRRRRPESRRPHRADLVGLDTGPEGPVRRPRRTGGGNSRPLSGF